LNARVSRDLQLHGSGSGFTLLEVLVAIAVIATAMVSLLGLHGRNIQIIASDQHLARATILAQQVMTQALVSSEFPDPTQDRGDFADDPAYHWALEILRGPNRDIEELTREIRVSVWWSGGEDEAVTLATLVRKPDQ
jgi:general secretion pathway protein I